MAILDLNQWTERCYKNSLHYNHRQVIADVLKRLDTLTVSGYLIAISTGRRIGHYLIGLRVSHTVIDSRLQRTVGGSME